MGKNRLIAYIYILASIVMWGVAGPVIKYTLEGIDPMPFLAYRFSISALVAVLFFGLRGFSLKKYRSNLVGIVFYGLTSTVIPLTLLFVGLDMTNVLTFSIMTSTIPLISAYFGSAFLKDRITKREKLGMMVAFAGTLITITAPLVENSHGETRLLGNLLIFVFILVDCYSYIIAKKLLRKGIGSAALSNFAFLVGFICLVPTVLYFNPSSLGSVTGIPLNYHLGVLYMAIFSGTIAYALWNRGQRTIEVSEAAVFKYLDPLIAAPLAVLWLGEKITLSFITGALIIGAGVFIAETKARRR